MVDPDLTEQLLQAVLPSNGSVAVSTASSHPEESEPTTTNGIIPGVIAAGVFIALLLSLYAVLWKCMLSPQPRKHRKMRLRVQQRGSV